MNTQVQIQLQALQDEITNLREQVVTNQDLTVSELAAVTANVSFLLTDVAVLNNHITTNTNTINSLQSNFQNHYHRYYDQDRIYWWNVYQSLYRYYYFSGTSITSGPSY